jgi:hypothetical protein
MQITDISIKFILLTLVVTTFQGIINKYNNRLVVNDNVQGKEQSLSNIMFLNWNCMCKYSVNDHKEGAPQTMSIFAVWF